MKLKLLATNSQRNPEWALTLLGYNTNPIYNIGNYGCLITASGNYIGKKPNEVNDILKANGGFTQGGGDMVWSACKALGLTQVYQSPYYADAVSSQGLTKMRSLLDEGRPLITHIDFNPATTKDDMHWLLVYGYDDNDVFYCLDSWTGTRITLDVYGGVKRAVLEYRAYDKTLEKESGVMVEVESHTFEELVRKSTITDKVALKLNVEVSEAIILADLDKMITLEDVVVQKDKQLTEAQQKVLTLEKTVSDKEGELTKLQEALKILTDQTNKAVEDNKILSAQVAQLKKDCKVPTFTGWKLNLWKWLQKQ